MSENAAGNIRNLDEAMGLERIEPAETDADRERWIGWLGQIDRDLSDLAISRLAWRSLTTVWRERQPPLPPSFIFDVLAQNYAYAQASGVRRQADPRKDVASLRRLVAEIEAHPDKIDVRFYVGRYQWGQQHLGHAAFKNLDPSGTGHIDPAIPGADREVLAAIWKEDVVQWVHKTVAHTSEVPAETVPTFDELDQAQERIVEIYMRWHVILTGADLVSMEPFPQYDYLAPLRVPWILGSE